MDSLSALSGLDRNTVVTFVALGLSAVALIVSLWNVVRKSGGRWGRKLREPYPVPCDTSLMKSGTAAEKDTKWLMRTAPLTDPNLEILAGLEEWPEWAVDVEKRWQKPDEKLPGDPRFRIKS